MSGLLRINLVRCERAPQPSFVLCLAALLDHHSNLGPAEIPAKRRYTFQDAERWAVYLGLKFKSPPAHPFNSLTALRVTSSIDNDGVREAFAVRLLDAAWSEGRDIASESVDSRGRR